MFEGPTGVWDTESNSSHFVFKEYRAVFSSTFFSLHHMVSKNSGHILQELLDPFCVVCFRWAAIEALNFSSVPVDLLLLAEPATLKVPLWDTARLKRSRFHHRIPVSCSSDISWKKSGTWVSEEEIWSIILYSTVTSALNSLHFPWFSCKFNAGNKKRCILNVQVYRKRDLTIGKTDKRVWDVWVALH